MRSGAGPTRDTVSYAAFLRGINVGGHRKIRMADLRAALEAQGYANVKTVLASGNIRFDAEERDASQLRKALERLLRQEFGHEIPVLVRTVAALQRLVQTKPFEGIAATPETRLYVSFLPETQGTSETPLEEISQEGFTVVHMTSGEVCSVLTLSSAYGTVDFMARLEGIYGPRITTRTWQTITRLLALK